MSVNCSFELTIAQKTMPPCKLILMKKLYTPAVYCKLENTLKVDPNAGMVPGYKFGGGEIAETFEGQIVTLVI